MTEVPLGGGALTEGVVRVGDTVRRPVVPIVREVLQRLEHAGFDAAPRWLGVDEQGRDMLTWLEGDTYVVRGELHPYLGDGARVVFDETQLAAVFALLRRYHDAFGDDVICHGDYGPWNLVWREGLPVAMFDFDHAYHGDPAEDVAYALRFFVSHAFVDDAERRTRVALDAYGRGFDVQGIMRREYERGERACIANGWHRQLARLPVERAWLFDKGV